jgi:hypothetical protein
LSTGYIRSFAVKTNQPSDLISGSLRNNRVSQLPNLKTGRTGSGAFAEGLPKTDQGGSP